MNPQSVTVSFLVGPSVRGASVVRRFNQLKLRQEEAEVVARVREWMTSTAPAGMSRQVSTTDALRHILATIGEQLRIQDEIHEMAEKAAGEEAQRAMHEAARATAEAALREGDLTPAVEETLAHLAAAELPSTPPAEVEVPNIFTQQRKKKGAA